MLVTWGLVVWAAVLQLTTERSLAPSDITGTRCSRSCSGAASFVSIGVLLFVLPAVLGVDVLSYGHSFGDALPTTSCSSLSCLLHQRKLSSETFHNLRRHLSESGPPLSGATGINLSGQKGK